MPHTSDAAEDAKDAVDTNIFFLIVCDTLGNAGVLESFGRIIKSKGDKGLTSGAAAAAASPAAGPACT